MAALTHVRLPQLQPQYQNMCSYINVQYKKITLLRKLKYRLFSFYQRGKEQVGTRYVLLIILERLSFPLKLGGKVK